MDKRSTVVRVCKTEDEQNECESAATAETECGIPPELSRRRPLNKDTEAANKTIVSDANMKALSEEASDENDTTEMRLERW